MEAWCFVLVCFLFFSLLTQMLFKIRLGNLESHSTSSLLAGLLRPVWPFCFMLLEIISPPWSLLLIWRKKFCRAHSSAGRGEQRLLFPLFGFTEEHCLHFTILIHTGIALAHLGRNCFLPWNWIRYLFKISEWNLACYCYRGVKAFWGCAFCTTQGEMYNED